MSFRRAIGGNRNINGKIKGLGMLAGLKIKNEKTKMLTKIRS